MWAGAAGSAGCEHLRLNPVEKIADRIGSGEHASPSAERLSPCSAVTPPRAIMSLPERGAGPTEVAHTAMSAKSIHKA